MNFAIAAKALILRKSKLLLLKRKDNNPHYAGKWDIPGGRIHPGEDPIQGLIRECAEEIGLRIQLIAPIGVNHFARDDGQAITMIIFLCEMKGSDKVVLSDEHVEAVWVDLNRNALPSWLHNSLENLRNLTKLDIDIP